MKTKLIDTVVTRAFMVTLAVSAGVIIGISSERAHTTAQADVPTEVHQCPEAEIVPVYIEVPVYVEVEPERVYYDVPLSKELQDHIFAECEKHGIDPSIVVAMCFRESSYNASAIGDNGKSFGLMQIQLQWNSERMECLGCDDLLDPFQNVTVGVDILAELLDKHDGDIAKALVAYNQGSFKGTVTQYAKDVMGKARELK